MSLQIMLDQVRAKPSTAVALEEPLEVAALPTPALVLNRPALQHNIQKMASFLAAHDKDFRPHAKTHKCPLISQAQLQAGAVGVCVAKVGEAAAQIAAGVSQVLITSPVASPTKARLVAELARAAQDLIIVVDSEVGLRLLQQELHPQDQIGILLDIDVAMGRTGTRTVQELLQLVGRVADDPRTVFRGVQHYAGHLMHVKDFATRRQKSLALWSEVVQRLEQLHRYGYACEIVTGAGTGTYNIDVEVAELTDLQVGSYIFMDEEYRCVGNASGGRFEDFEVALTVACTTISQPRPGTITVDGGYKAFASDSVSPVSDELAGVSFHFAGDEHGVLALPAGEQSVQLGQVLSFVTPHCDPTVNLHDFYWVQEADGLIHNLWPITGRGCAW